MLLVYVKGRVTLNVCVCAFLVIRRIRSDRSIDSIVKYCLYTPHLPAYISLPTNSYSQQVSPAQLLPKLPQELLGSSAFIPDLCVQNKIKRRTQTEKHHPSCSHSHTDSPLPPPSPLARSSSDLFRQRCPTHHTLLRCCHRHTNVSR